MRAAVLGGAGFIGSELARQLVQEGMQVVIVDNLQTGKLENVRDILGEEVKLVVADIRQTRRMEEILEAVDIVFHLACLGVRHSLHSPFENHEVNASAVLGLLLAARKSDVKRFVYVSSSEVYGKAFEVPMPESHPTFPRTVYGASKLAGESYVRAFYEAYGFPTVVVRPFNTYGPRCHHEGDSGEVIPRFMLRCMAARPMVIFGDGKQTRDFLYVTDTAKGILRAGLCDQAIGETIHVASGAEISIHDLARKIADVIECPHPEILYDRPRPGDVTRHCADISKAEKILKVKPQVGLHEGLMKLKDWYLGQTKLPEELLKEEILYNWEAREVLQS